MNLSDRIPCQGPNWSHTILPANPTDQVYAALSAHDQLRMDEVAASLVGTERHDEAEVIALCLAALVESLKNVHLPR